MKQRLSRFLSSSVGDWRVICELQDERKRLVVRTVGHRREIYRPKR
jgi:mRNA-degrading endonuclease RelE of RelBE toxin-antitoxin system